MRLRKQLRVEPLESRFLMATYVVDSLLDVVDPSDGVMTLREAMNASNATVDQADIIRFADNVRGTIQLTDGQLEYTDSSLTLTGPGADLLTIRAADPTPTVLDGNGSRILEIGDFPAEVEHVEVFGLTMEGGDTPGDGGAIRVGSFTSLVVERTIFRRNNTGECEEIFGVSDGQGDGGAISATRASLVTVKDSWFDRNQSCGDGGAIKATAVRIIGSTFTGNFTYGDRNADGGAIATRGGAVEISHSTFRESAVLGSVGPGEGAVLNVRTGQPVRITNSTIVDNYGPQPAIHVEGPLTIENSILANDSNLRLSRGAPFRFNFLSNNVGTRIRPTNGGVDEFGNIVGSSIAPLDPLLGPISDNGGYVPTQLPLDGSPTIDSGDPDYPVEPGSKDQRDRARRSGARIDMGATEFQHEGPGIDVDQDGAIACADLDAIQAGTPDIPFDPRLDMTVDGQVDRTDVDEWLIRAGIEHETSSPFRYGDANLDGHVDTEDFNRWQSNKFTNASSWCQGNFNGDAVVDVSDFNVWNENRFTVSRTGTRTMRDPRPAAQFKAAILLDDSTGLAKETSRTIPSDASVSAEKSHIAVKPFSLRTPFLRRTYGDVGHMQVRYGPTSHELLDELFADPLSTVFSFAPFTASELLVL